MTDAITPPAAAGGDPAAAGDASRIGGSSATRDPTAAGDPSATRVGFSGLGRMGRLMAANLQEAGFDLTVHNRTGARAESFAASTGAKVAASGRQLAEAASVIVTMVADGPALASLLEGPDGVVAGLSAGDIVVDMGTSGPGAHAAGRAGPSRRPAATSSRRRSREAPPPPSPPRCWS